MTLAARHWDPGLGPLQVVTVRRVLEREGMGLGQVIYVTGTVEGWNVGE